MTSSYHYKSKNCVVLPYRIKTCFLTCCHLILYSNVIISFNFYHIPRSSHSRTCLIFSYHSHHSTTPKATSKHQPPPTPTSPSHFTPSTSLIASFSLELTRPASHLPAICLIVHGGALKWREASISVVCCCRRGEMSSAPPKWRALSSAPPK